MSAAPVTLTGDDLAEMEAVLACIASDPKAAHLAGRDRLLAAVRELQSYRRADDAARIARPGAKLSRRQMQEIRSRLAARAAGE